MSEFNETILAQLKTRKREGGASADAVAINGPRKAATGRTAQINIRVTKILKAEVHSEAMRRGVLIAVVFEEMWRAYQAQGNESQ